MRWTALLGVTLALVAIGVAQSGTDWVAEGQTAMKRGDYEKAVHAFLEALKERPDDGELRLQLGEALLHLQRAQEAAPTSFGRWNFSPPIPARRRRLCRKFAIC